MITRQEKPDIEKRGLLMSGIIQARQYDYLTTSVGSKRGTVITVIDRGGTLMSHPVMSKSFALRPSNIRWTENVRSNSFLRSSESSLSPERASSRSSGLAWIMASSLSRISRNTFTLDSTRLRRLGERNARSISSGGFLKLSPKRVNIESILVFESALLIDQSSNARRNCQANLLSKTIAYRFTNVKYIL